MLREHYKSHTTGYENCLSLTTDTIHANKIGKTLPATTNTICSTRKSIGTITLAYLQIPSRLSPNNSISLPGAQQPHGSL